MLKSNGIAYPNLRAEMGRKNLTIGEISERIDMRRETLGRKLSRKSPISLREAFLIQTTFFPDSNVRYLFAEDGDNSAS